MTITIPPRSGAPSTSGADYMDAVADAFDDAVAEFRPRLAANRTYYVRTDGSNSNTGLANTSGGAFLTLQKALDVAATLDFSGYTVTIQIGDGTYTAGATVPVCVGQKTAANLVIQGNSGTPANVLISTTSATAITAAPNAMLRVKDLELRTTTSGNALATDGPGAVIEFANLRFGACAGAHVFADGGRISATGNYTISGGASNHVWARNGGAVNTDFRTATLSGTPAFSTAYALVQGGYFLAGAMTFSGSATGVRYSATLNGVINTVGGGASYLPGNSAGSTATGGQYA